MASVKMVATRIFVRNVTVKEIVKCAMGNLAVNACLVSVYAVGR